MAINPHHTIEEINGVRCSVIEKNISKERAQFLTKVLECNGKSVQIKNNEDGTAIIGIDDIIFNPLHSLYNRSLKTPEGKVLTPAYWFQKEQTEGYYWNYK